MSGMQDERTVYLAAKIEAYLAAHPNAADTIDGISAWWLAGRRGVLRTEDVQQALNYLAAQGKVTCTRSADGHVLYAGAN